MKLLTLPLNYIQKVLNLILQLPLITGIKKLLIYKFFFSNRSMAYLKKELYGLALADANKSIELDSTYVKGYFRRASASMALAKFKFALKDYETVNLNFFFFCTLISF